MSRCDRVGPAFVGDGMDRWRAIVWAGVLSISPALADDTVVPLSVWKTGSDGAALHLQSSWDCPAAFGDFTRDRLHVYDTYGLDVDCNYADGSGGEITLYMTKHPNDDPDADLENGKGAILKHMPDAVPLAAADQATFPSTMAFSHFLYAIRGGRMHTGVWFGNAGDWVFEIRATYAADRQTAVFDTLSRMSAHLTDGAGAHLSRCAKSSVPARDGAVVKAAGTELNAMILAYLTVVAVDNDPETKDKHPLDTKTEPVEWCAEDGVAGASAPVLMWHGLSADGAPAEGDRASLMTVGEPLVLEARLNGELNLIESELKSGELPIYDVAMNAGDELVLYQFFSRKPKPEALAQILADIATHKARIYGKMNLKTHAITLTMPGSP